MESLIAIHEAIEATLCLRAGISEEAVNAFDIEFEKARETGRDDRSYFVFRDRQVDADAEPGDQPDAPYYKQHQLATAVERMMAAEMGVDWTTYEEANEALYR